MNHESNMNTNMKKRTIRKEKKSTSSMVFLYSMVVNICGGLFLSYWLYKYHPTNSNLWMVPLGLIFFITPAFLSLSLLISDLCDDDDDDDDDVNLDLNHIRIIL